MAFDESGNTHGNLLDPGQRVAVVASVLLSDEQADECLAALRRETRQSSSAEVHYKGLKSSRARRGVRALLSNDVLTPDTVRVVVAHKPFATVCKLVDLTIEPMLHEAGHNLYDDEMAKTIADLLHSVAPVLSDKARWELVLAAFNNACSRPSSATISAYVTAVVEWHETADRIIDLADHVLHASAQLPSVLTEATAPATTNPLDLALPLFVVLAREWTDALTQDFVALHDHSRTLERWLDVLHNLGDLPDPTGHRPRLAPLGIAPDQLIPDADSKNHPRLQVADVVVGSVREWTLAVASRRALSEYEAELQQLTSPWVVDAIWPERG